MSGNQGGERLLTIVSRSDDRGAAVLAVRDTGIGVDSGKLNEVFDAFVTTKPLGMGLGLAICRTIIERTTGSILEASATGGRNAATPISTRDAHHAAPHVHGQHISYGPRRNSSAQARGVYLAARNFPSGPGGNSCLATASACLRVQKRCCDRGIDLLDWSTWSQDSDRGLYDLAETEGTLFKHLQQCADA